MPEGASVVHTSRRIIIAIKPAGLVLAEPGSRKPNLLNHLREMLGGPGKRPAPLFPLTWLDKEASGLVAFARNKADVEPLMKRIRTSRLGQRHLALVAGEVEPGFTATIQSRLFENRRGVMQSAESEELEAAKDAGVRANRAISHIQSLATKDGLSLLRVRTETDHRMQIRAHLAERGTPIVGDRAYASPRDEGGRLALHCVEIINPEDDGPPSFRFPAPAHFYELVDQPVPSGAIEDERNRAEDPDTDPESILHSAEGAPEIAGWDHVSEWYDTLTADKGSDFHEAVIHPGVKHLLAEAGFDPAQNHALLDIACGPGHFAKSAADAGAQVTAVDLSPQLIEAAKARSPESVRYLVADAQNLTDTEDLEPNTFDAAVCIMALMNIPDARKTLAGAAHLLKPGGTFVAVTLHPAFRATGRTSWGWIGRQAEQQHQFRRVDAYLSHDRHEITMNPGAAAEGEQRITTTTYHRPIGAYLTATGNAGLLTRTVEEWPSHRQSAPGPRSNEENRARNEIPMFLAWSAIKPG